MVGLSYDNYLQERASKLAAEQEQMMQKMMQQ